MRPVSDAFSDVITGSHAMRSVARLCDTYQTGTSPTGVTLSDGTTSLPIADGKVISDASADVQMTLELTTTEPWSTKLYPVGSEIWVSRGVQFNAGSFEMVSQGYFRIQKLEQIRRPFDGVRITAMDRMSGIISARLPIPVQFAAGTTVGTIMSTLVNDVYPLATIEYDDTLASRTIPRMAIADRDRYTFLRDMLRGYGKIMHWDYRGVLVVRSVPNPTVPVWTCAAGAGGVLIDASRTVTSQGRYNGVVVLGEGTDTLNPVRALAYDNDPASLTYWYGPYLKVPRFLSSSFITTVAQAQDTAISELAKEQGLPYSANFSAVPNPALEVFDAVEFRDRDGIETHVIDKITLSLTVQAAMAGTTRKQISGVVGVE